MTGFGKGAGESRLACAVWASDEKVHTGRPQETVSVAAGPEEKAMDSPPGGTEPMNAHQLLGSAKHRFTGHHALDGRTVCGAGQLASEDPFQQIPEPVAVRPRQAP